MLNAEVQLTTPMSSTSAKWKCQMEVPKLLCLSYLMQCHFEDQVAWGTQEALSHFSIHGKMLLNSKNKEV